MNDILLTIAEHSRLRVAADMQKQPLNELRQLCSEAGPGNGEAFLSALRKPGISFICEIKKASPSKGLISPDFPYLDIAAEYEAAGADCISCLTEPNWFLGSDDIFRAVRRKVSLPMLRKDFTVDPYQLYQARLLGANAVLLICSLLEGSALKEYIQLADELGLAAVTEAHNDKEIDNAVRAGSRIIGINNRNLRDFSVDITNSSRLRNLVPEGTLFIAESGIKTPEDIRILSESRTDAVLIGETLMKASDKKAMLAALRGGSQ